MSQQIPYVIEVSRYTGSKKPMPPESTMTVKVQSLSNLAKTAIILSRVKERDFEFLNNVCGHECPEYNGFTLRKQEKKEYHYSKRLKQYIFRSLICLLLNMILCLHQCYK